MRKLAIGIVFIPVFTLIAQQEPLITQFWNNYSFYNPALSGAEYRTQASLIYREQWVNLNNAPQTIAANVNHRLDEKHSIGINLSTDNIGFLRRNEAILNYSYRLILNADKKESLLFGAGFGILHQNLDIAVFTGNTNLPDASLKDERSSFPKLNAGLAYQRDKLLVGMGATQIFGDAGKTSFVKPVPHFYGLISYDLRNFIGPLGLLPRAFIRITEQVSVLDLSAMITYKNQFGVGLTLRNNDNVCFIAEWNIHQKFRIAYSYDYILSPSFRQVAGATHEFVLGYNLR